MTGGEPVGPAVSEPLGLRTQLARFVVTGVVSAVVDFGLLVALMNLAGLDHTAAKAISFVAGTTTAYLINRRWTFRSDGSRRKFAAVMLLYGLTFGLQVGLFAVLYPWILQLTGSQTAGQAVGFVIAQGVATSVNFVVQRSLIFR